MKGWMVGHPDISPSIHHWAPRSKLCVAPADATVKREGQALPGFAPPSLRNFAAA